MGKTPQSVNTPAQRQPSQKQRGQRWRGELGAHLPEPSELWLEEWQRPAVYSPHFDRHTPTVLLAPLSYCLFLLPFPSSETSSPSLLWWSLSQEVAPPSKVMLRLEAWTSTLFPVWSARPPERSQMQIHFSLLFACSTFRFGLIPLFSRFPNVLRLLHLPEAIFLTHLLMLPGALQGRVGSFSQGGFYQLPPSIWVLEAIWSILSPGMFSSHGIPVKTLEMHSVSNSTLYTENWSLLKLCK